MRQAGVGGEQLRVRDVGAGIAALDVVDPQLVQRPGDQPLVLEREVDAGGLRAVAQRRVEQIEPLLLIAVSRYPSSAQRDIDCRTASTMIFSAR